MVEKKVTEFIIRWQRVWGIDAVKVHNYKICKDSIEMFLS